MWFLQISFVMNFDKLLPVVIKPYLSNDYSERNNFY